MFKIFEVMRGLGLDHVNSKQERIELSLFEYYWKLLCKLWLYDIKCSIWIQQWCYGCLLEWAWFRVFIIMYNLSEFELNVISWIKLSELWWWLCYWILYICGKYYWWIMKSPLCDYEWLNELSMQMSKLMEVF